MLTNVLEVRYPANYLRLQLVSNLQTNAAVFIECKGVKMFLGNFYLGNKKIIKRYII